MNNRNNIYQKKICFTICFAVFLFFCFIIFPSNKVSALTLEVQYPTITLGGQSAGTPTDLPSYARYLFFFGTAFGFFCVFLSFVIAGALYILSPANPEARTNAKDRFSGAIAGLLILALAYLIISTINPQLNILTIDAPAPSPTPAAPPPPPGIYFYNGNSCQDAKNPSPYTSSVQDLGQGLRNKVNSARFVQDTKNGNSYISVLYNTINFQGKCEFVDPNNKSCQTIAPFSVSSVSVLNFNSSPNGDGVYFYRKPCFNKIGNPGSPLNINSLVSYCNGKNDGWYESTNSDIQGQGGNLFVLNLNQTKFKDVPDEQQDCVEYDKYGNCTGRQAPSLGGDNISTIVVNGNYAVLLVYAGPKDGPSGPWSYCELFPGIDDANNIGPMQVKWENIRNHGDVVPNYAIIIPINK